MDWIPLAECVNGTLRLIALDLRGHGESAHQEQEAYEHLDHLSDLILTVEAIGQPVTVIGHSLSGHLSLFLAALCPDLVGALVLVDVEAFPPRAQPDQLRRLGTRPHPIDDNREQALARLRRRLPGVRDDILGEKVDRDLLTLENGSLTPRFDRAVLRRLSAPDARPFLPMIQCPTLLVRGQESEVMRRSAAVEMERAIPNARWTEIPAAGHSPHLENPAEFSDVVLRFLQELPE